MEQNIQELSDLVQKDKSFSNTVGTLINKTGKFLYQTIRQSLDADIFLAGFAVSYFVATNYVPELKDASFAFLAVAAKQYAWGHLAYDDAKYKLNKPRNVSEEAFEKTFSLGSAGLCFYCGSRYALREYKKQMAKDVQPLAD